ncbi:MAG: OsmC family protein [Thermaurantimonas sp.]|uniref:OsmC family protein n=1 Tax=Thermaurantimonas sp. TaxID=2681568 RepID=UPI0039198B51
MHHKVELFWRGEETFDIHLPDGNTLLVQTESLDTFSSKGLRPKPLMLASLAGCTAIDVVMLMKKMRLDVEAFKVCIIGELTTEHPKFYKKVEIQYHFTGANLDVEKLTRCVKLSEEKYCGVMHMFRQFAQLEIDIHMHTKEVQSANPSKLL